MEQEDSYDGRPDSVVWFRARTNCLTLGDRNRRIGGDIGCFMCGGELDDLKHFILECDSLDRIRKKLTRLQRPRVEDWRETLEEFLYGEERQKSREDLAELWRKRQKRRKIWEASRDHVWNFWQSCS